jgi:thermitase
MKKWIQAGNRFALYCLVLILVFGLMFILAAMKHDSDKFIHKPLKNYVEGQVLVKFKSHVSDNAVTAAVNNKGDLRVRDISLPRKAQGAEKVALLELDKAKSVKSAVEEYKNDSSVEYAQPNYIYHATATVPNDSYYGNLWGLKNIGQIVINPSYTTDNPGTSGCDLKAESSWDEQTDCSSVIVAIVDSGVNYNHEDLAGNMWDDGSGHHGYNYVDNTDDPMDYHGHGTHVAGTIGAVGNNGIGTTGICWKVKIMAVRALDAAGSGTTATIVSGINYAVSHGAKIINLSLGGQISFDQSFSNAIDNAKNNDVLVVTAAGNDNVDVDSAGNASYPCNFSQDNVVCVAALDQSYKRASFSNYGSTSVDVGAPGTNIMSIWNGTDVENSENFISGWNITNSHVYPHGWSEGNVTTTSATYPSLMDPADFNGSNTYLSSSTDRAWKNYSFSGADGATLSFYAYINTENNYDFLNVYYYPGGGSPFISGTRLDHLSGTTGGYFYLFSYDISKSLASTMSVGFELTSDSISNYSGVALVEMAVTSVILNATSFNTIDGTSMASPHVAGVAALIKANRPSYTYTDLVNAIKKGGEACPALQGVTTTGKAVSAWGAMCYIRPPRNVTCSQL